MRLHVGTVTGQKVAVGDLKMKSSYNESDGGTARIRLGNVGRDSCLITQHGI